MFIDGLIHVPDIAQTIYQYNKRTPADSSKSRLNS